MRVLYYDSYPNFGDQLNRSLWTPYFQPWLTRRDDISLLGVGTLLGERDYGPGRVLVCGAGFGYRADTAALRSERAHVCFVRGPLSARVLGLDASYAVTDPAALVPIQHAASPASGRALFVPHWETAANPLWRAACARAEIDYADPRAEVPQVLSQISGARLVLAESLHAAICADAYRVPWLPVLTSTRVNYFKWQDWLSSLQLQPRFTQLPGLGCSDLARNLEPVPPLPAALEAALGEAPPALDPHAAADVFAWMMRVTHATPQQRSRVLHSLLWRVGPRLDALVLRTGVAERNLDQASAALQRLAAGDGELSDDTNQRNLLARLEEKIAAAQRVLEHWSTPAAACV